MLKPMQSFGTKLIIDPVPVAGSLLLKNGVTGRAESLTGTLEAGMGPRQCSPEQTFSTVLVQIWAVLDSGAVSRLCSRAMTSAAMLLATWPLMKGLTGSDLQDQRAKVSHCSTTVAD